MGVELPIQRVDFARLMENDPSVKFARTAAREHPPPSHEKNPGFMLDRRVLYQWIKGQSQVVVPIALCPQVLP